MFHVKHGHPTVEFNSLLWPSVNALRSPYVSRDTKPLVGSNSSCPIRHRSTREVER